MTPEQSDPRETREAIERRLLATQDEVHKGVQALLVAHGAALLALATTYIKTDAPTPESVTSFARIFGYGFIFAIFSVMSQLMVRVSALRLHQNIKKDWIAFSWGAYAHMLFGIISLFYLFMAVMKVLFSS